MFWGVLVAVSFFGLLSWGVVAVPPPVALLVAFVGVPVMVIGGRLLPASTGYAPLYVAVTLLVVGSTKRSQSLPPVACTLLIPAGGVKVAVIASPAGTGPAPTL